VLGVHAKTRVVNSFSRVHQFRDVIGLDGQTPNPMAGPWPKHLY